MRGRGPQPGEVEEEIGAAEVGDRLTLRYSYTPSEPLQYLESLATASIRSDDPVALNFKTARMTLVPQPTGSVPAIGLELRQFTVVRSAP